MFFDVVVCFVFCLDFISVLFNVFKWVLSFCVFLSKCLVCLFLLLNMLVVFVRLLILFLWVMLGMLEILLFLESLLNIWVIEWIGLSILCIVNIVFVRVSRMVISENNFLFCCVVLVIENVFCVIDFVWEVIWLVNLLLRYKNLLVEFVIMMLIKNKFFWVICVSVKKFFLVFFSW